MSFFSIIVVEKITEKRNEMNDYRFGNFVYQLREKKGLTQAELARLLGVTPAAVSKWENGSSKPRVEVLFQLADILEVRPEELIEGRYLPKESLNPESVKQLNERYEYLRRVEGHDTFGIKLRRCIAFIIDWNICGLITFMLLFISLMFVSDVDNLSDWEVFLHAVLPIMMYPVLVSLRDVIFGKRSPGKRIMRLIVLDRTTGEVAGLGKRIVRGLTLLLVQVDVIVLLVSGFSIGDHVAKTVVVPKSAIDQRDSDGKIDIVNEINKYHAPKNVSWRKIVASTALIIAGFFVLIIIITLITLSASKNTEEYKVAYNYFIESDTFESLDADEADIFMNSYSSRTEYQNGEGFKTVQIGFVVKFKSYTVVCHGDERGNWFVCDECTLLK